MERRLEQRFRNATCNFRVLFFFAAVLGCRRIEMVFRAGEAKYEEKKLLTSELRLACGGIEASC